MARNSNKRRWDVCTPADRVNDRGEVTDTFWPRVGSAFENPPKERDGTPTISILLDALPLNGKLVLFEPRPDDDRSRSNDNRRRR